ncbi:MULTISPECIES: DNA (cytosine-5-)-methyltransferase [Bacilli]|uniref:DNA (cytosine-5-)-methyltransferase n=1 Tax=Bacilli TaxID=91061 RepID=UPI0009B28A28|nr:MULTISPECIES: DNA (cytosine-5-)-methyltransferase [Bacilli]MBE9446781.1 DNA (cytosine-5-)-methyltransferase [Enterococcus faecalis]RFT99835.1 DNA (cytosine-5-)-methyltransferase [Staphylococcus haemolyticus]RFU00529.1 DNA (cytosine-5-)-methyltransferase [Staphylococcus haemolyticus]
MKFIDICSGIGGFRSALEKHGHECVAFAEIDKFAKQSYKAIYETENEEELDDITSVTDEHFRLYRGQVDIITGGFPCQAFSIAGNRRGFEDTRGTIFFHIARAIKEIQPSYVLLENVKGLLSHDKGRTYGTIVQALDELGYFIEWGLFNSKYWGVPQNRERVYILVTRKDVWKEPKLFNLVKQQTSVDTRLVDILEKDVDESYYLSEEKTRKLTLNEDLSGRLNHYDYRDVDSVHSVNRVSPTLNTMQGGDRQPKVAIPVLTPNRLNKRQNGRRFKENGEPMFTLTSQDRHGIAIKEATKKGYAEAMEGDSVNTSFPNNKTRRGRVGKQVAQTLQAREVNQGVVVDKGHNFYAKDNILYDERQYVNLPDQFEPDYIYVEPVIKVIDKEHIILINSDDEQYEILKIKNDYYLSLGVSHNLKDVIQYVPKEQYGRLGKQASETMNENIDLIEEGMTINSYNKTLNSTGVSPTVTTRPEGFKTAILPVTNNLRIRKLTPLECWRLQGFSDEQFYKAKNSGVSNSQLYKQAGNAVTVNVVDAIVGELE